MNLRPIDNYFSEKEEPIKSCLLYLRKHIISFDNNITEEWKYGMPFYCINNKMMCYIWTHKKLGLPYLGIVEGSRIDRPELIREKRAKMKILLIDPARDIPVKLIDDVLKDVLTLYKLK